MGNQRPTLAAVTCLWCGALVRLKRDGTVSRHSVGRPGVRHGMELCVGSERPAVGV
jgi:hypothetical protein